MSKRSSIISSNTQPLSIPLPQWYSLGSLVSDANCNWSEPSQLAAMPAKARTWLLDSGSLTARLKALSGGDFAVEIVDELWAPLPGPDFRSQFGPVCPSHLFWSRRVVLFGNGEPWVFAHTLIPKHSLGGDLGDVILLGEKPLGEYLFSQRGLSRSEIEVTKVDEESWGRRSWFFLESKPVMVAEYFLPSLLRQNPSKN